MDDFSIVLERIMRATLARTQVELAAILGIRQSSISDAKKRKSVPSDWVLKLQRAYGLNPDWLLDGIEPVYLRRTDKPQHITACEAAGVYGAPKPQYRPVQVSCVAGPKAEQGNVVFEAKGEVGVPEDLDCPSLLIVRMDGTSMEPLIRKSAYIGLDREQRHIRSGEVYGLFIPVEGLVVKRVFIDAENGRYILRSENRLHPDMSIPIEGSGEQIIGRAIWILQDM